MRILCLHGYSQNSAIFSKKLKVLEKSLKADLVIPDAPHFIPDSQELRCWWRASDDRLTYHGLQDSITFIKNIYDSQSFDLILGFSQGATFAAILSQILKPKLLIIVSGFLPFPPNLQYSQIPINSLHIIGKSDDIVPLEENFKLSQTFTNPTIYIHEGGHYLPLNQESLATIRNFIHSI
jgi:predicted esterase